MNASKTRNAKATPLEKTSPSSRKMTPKSRVAAHTGGETPNGSTVSVWMSNRAPLPSTPLEADVSADVCIVGGGISGLTAAYLLCREGQSVIVLDDGPIGGGQTQRTTAHLSNAIDDRYCEIERVHGPIGARIAAESHSAAIDCIEQTIEREGVECEFARVDGYLFQPPDDTSDLLEREIQAAHRAGLADVEWVARAPLSDFNTGRCLRFPDQGQFHPMLYLEGLARTLQRNGARIFTQTHAASVQGGESAVVTSATGKRVTAGAVIVATNSPINNLVAIHTKQAPYMTYVIGVRIPSGVVERALYWDTMDPYHYVRTCASPVRLARGVSHDEILIVGGEDHKTGQEHGNPERFRRLEEWARIRFPQCRAIEFEWSGQVMETVDGLAFIGSNPLDDANVYVATGDSGMGLTHGTIAGLLLTDLIMGRKNPWASVYDPSRVSLRSAPSFARENLNVAAQYADWLTGGEVEDLKEIAPGMGAVVRRGLRKVAVFRDDIGRIHERSAICPHLGCIVAWNRTENTWDCPCHGSRFDCLGGVLSGPANRDLDPV